MKQSYWIFGKNAVIAALNNPDREILELRATAKVIDNIAHFISKRNIITKEFKGQELDVLLPDVAHQGVAIRVKPLEKHHIDWIVHKSLKSSKVLILDQITDPQNIGAMIRTAAAFSVDAIIIANRNSIIESGVIAKTAAGALELVPVIEVSNLVEAIKKLKKDNYWVFAMDGRAKDSVNVLSNYDKIAIVMGSEGYGIRDLVKKNCDLMVKIPIDESVESLNVSNACAIALFAAS